jgi:hypothetical protein
MADKDGANTTQLNSVDDSVKIEDVTVNVDQIVSDNITTIINHMQNNTIQKYPFAKMAIRVVDDYKDILERTFKFNLMKALFEKTTSSVSGTNKQPKSSVNTLKQPPITRHFKPIPRDGGNSDLPYIGRGGVNYPDSTRCEVRNKINGMLNAELVNETPKTDHIHGKIDSIITPVIKSTGESLFTKRMDKKHRREAIKIYNNIINRYYYGIRRRPSVVSNWPIQLRILEKAKEFVATLATHFVNNFTINHINSIVDISVNDGATVESKTALFKWLVLDKTVQELIFRSKMLYTDKKKLANIKEISKAIYGIRGTKYSNSGLDAIVTGLATQPILKEIFTGDRIMPYLPIEEKVAHPSDWFGGAKNGTHHAYPEVKTKTTRKIYSRMLHNVVGAGKKTVLPSDHKNSPINRQTIDLIESMLEQSNQGITSEINKELSTEKVLSLITTTSIVAESCFRKIVMKCMLKTLPNEKAAGVYMDLSDPTPIEYNQFCHIIETLYSKIYGDTPKQPDFLTLPYNGVVCDIIFLRIQKEISEILKKESSSDPQQHGLAEKVQDQCLSLFELPTDKAKDGNATGSALTPKSEGGGSFQTRRSYCRKTSTGNRKTRRSV